MHRTLGVQETKHHERLAIPWVPISGAMGARDQSCHRASAPPGVTSQPHSRTAAGAGEGNDARASAGTGGRHQPPTQHPALNHAVDPAAGERHSRSLRLAFHGAGQLRGFEMVEEGLGIPLWTAHQVGFLRRAAAIAVRRKSSMHSPGYGRRPAASSGQGERLGSRSPPPSELSACLASGISVV
jgi:hypothetical protein